MNWGKPKEIEEKSFAMIEEELNGKKFDPDEEPIIKRCIHTSADFDYAENLYFSPGAVKKLKDILQNGGDIVTDTTMAQAGINKKKLQSLGGQVHCFIQDEDVAKEAAVRKTTRSHVAVEKAKKLKKPFIYVVGNAPTALFSLHHLIVNKEILPGGIIGVPVGFVNVVESKTLIQTLKVPMILSMGRKGGSNIGAAIINGMLYTL